MSDSVNVSEYFQNKLGLQPGEPILMSNIMKFNLLPQEEDIKHGFIYRLLSDWYSYYPRYRKFSVEYEITKGEYLRDLKTLVSNNYITFADLKAILTEEPWFYDKLNKVVIDRFRSELEDLFVEDDNSCLYYNPRWLSQECIEKAKKKRFDVMTNPSTPIDVQEKLVYNYVDHHQNVYGKLGRFLSLHARAIPDVIIEEEPYRSMVLRVLASKQFQKLFRLFELGIVGSNEFIRTIKEIPSSFHEITKEQYEKYPELIELLKNSDGVVFDFLPQYVREKEDVKECFKRNSVIYHKGTGRDNKGYDTNWLDENGNLIQFFKLANGYKIQSKEEYEKLVEAYLKMDCSVPNFCDIFHIDGPDGFNDLLDRIGRENTDNDERISVVKKKAAEKYMQRITDIADSYNKGEIDFKEYITYMNRPTHKITVLLPKIHDKRKFFMELAEYIDNSKENLLLYKLFTLFDANFETLPQTIKNTCGYNDPELVEPFKKLAVVVKKLSKYKTKYKRSTQYRTITRDGKTIEIDDKLIDQAYAYIKAHFLHLCDYTMTEIVEKIAFGEIDYENDTKVQKAAIKNRIASNIEKVNISSIDDYIDTFGSSRL